MKVINKQKRRDRRQRRVRARVFGTSEKPRLSVFRGLRGMYAQLIDDAAGKTLAAVHSKKIEVKKVEVKDRKANIAVAYLIGKELAEKAKALGITKVVFDRAGYKYHGRVAAVADGARDGGLML
ncbi:MAG: 50S ribosomal protein L18 [Candidatus Magasanikbacteria bacterium]|nr:50S ribosomal protein L18 [Candidatus Magasanikbacteria bacterium]